MSDPTFHNLAAVGLGGFAGSCLRYLSGHWIAQRVALPFLPWGTFFVNMVGCLVLGLVVGIAESRQALGTTSRLFLVVGLLGGFTTFSTFAHDTHGLLHQQELVRSLLNAMGQLILGVGGVWVGLALGRLL